MWTVSSAYLRLMIPGPFISTLSFSSMLFNTFALYNEKRPRKRIQSCPTPFSIMSSSDDLCLSRLFVDWEQYIYWIVLSCLSPKSRLSKRWITSLVSILSTNLWFSTNYTKISFCICSDLSASASAELFDKSFAFLVTLFGMNPFWRSEIIGCICFFKRFIKIFRNIFRQWLIKLFSRQSAQFEALLFLRSVMNIEHFFSVCIIPVSYSALNSEVNTCRLFLPRFWNISRVSSSGPAVLLAFFCRTAFATSYGEIGLPLEFAELYRQRRSVMIATQVFRVLLPSLYYLNFFSACVIICIFQAFDGVMHPEFFRQFPDSLMSFCWVKKIPSVSCGILHQAIAVWPCYTSLWCFYRLMRYVQYAYPFAISIPFEREISLTHMISSSKVFALTTCFSLHLQLVAQK